MPQIFPMNWMMITMFMLFIFFLIKSHIFFFKPQKFSYLTKKYNMMFMMHKNFKW
uniref:ATP synthase subunit 8 n=1 Tax=Hyalomma aegyptium TaxID=72854 RepID=A0A8E6Z996_9ACAR|nr:ATP synthase subunit 8 [Hyalomma aegyptium]